MADRDRGSVLMMVPAAVMIVLMLAAVAIDETSVYLAHRQLHSAAAAAANDALTAGLDRAHFEATGDYRLDPVRVRAAVQRTLSAQSSSLVDTASLGGPSISVDASGRQVVELTLTAEVALVFSGAVPGFDRTRRVSERVRATIVVQNP